MLSNGRLVYAEIVGRGRWWEDEYRVVDVDGRLIGFMGASTTGDDSPYDVGWEFDENSIHEAEPYEETVTKYRQKR